MTPKTCRLVLSLTRTSEEGIAGTVVDEGQGERSFEGWLELLALIDNELRGSDQIDKSLGPATERGTRRQPGRTH